MNYNGEITIVGDFGTSSARIGLAGEDHPQCNISSYIGISNKSLKDDDNTTTSTNKLSKILSTTKQPLLIDTELSNYNTSGGCISGDELIIDSLCYDGIIR